jgi:hypothetical protein
MRACVYCSPNEESDAWLVALSPGELRARRVARAMGAAAHDAALEALGAPWRGPKPP